MPPKKRGDSSLLSPQIFAASLTKLNIRIQGHSHEADVDVDVDVDVDQENQLPPPNLKGVSDHEINDANPHNGDSTAKKESKSMMSQVHAHVSVSAPIQILCTKEAMEFLRQAHSQFVGLLSSELASGQDCDSDTKSKKRQKLMRTKTKTKTEASKDGSDDNENSIRIIVPSLIKPALERLEFHEINIDSLDDIGTDADESSTKNNQTALTGTGTVSSTKRSRTNQRNASKSKASRVKKSLLNSATTEELLKEQEKLFASSVAKAKAKAKANAK